MNLNGGTPYANNANIVIDLDDYGITDGAITEDVTIRLVGSDVTTVNLGSLTVNGSLGSGAAKLSLLLASDTSFPVTSEVQLSAAFKNCGAITVSDSSLRDSTRAAIAIEGDLTGAITLGHIRRLQIVSVLDGEEEYLYGGELLGAVTATAENESVVTDTGLLDEFNNPYYAEPMAYVRASKKISGNLTATAGDIGIVSIGVTEAQTDGLQANVKALAGQIKNIYCAGAIGDSSASPAVRPEIWAHGNIGVIVALDNGAIEPAVLAKNFHASIKSGVERTDEDFPVVPSTDGAVHLIRTDGDYSGEIAVRNITQRGVDSEFLTARAGVLIGGEMLGPISVLYTVHGADIVASSFAAPIVIGIQLKGSIVATDPVNGTIDEVQVGYNYSDRAVEYAGMNSDIFASYGFARGFHGTNLPPNDGPLALANPELWLVGNFSICEQPNGLQLGSMDSVIRATRIHKLTIRAMSAESVPGDLKKGRPRIESPSIGECTIDFMRAGVLWSGEVEFDQTCDCVSQPQNCVIANVPSNDFASIEVLEIGCLSRYAAVWYQDCAYARVLGSVYGEVHVPSLAAAQTLWIGDSLGAVDEDPQYPGLLQCPPPGGDGFSIMTVFSPESGVIESDTTPRRMSDPTVGHIFVHAPQGLGGQVIINGNGGHTTSPTPAAWDGVVIVGEDDGEGRVTLAPYQEQPYRSPHYKLSSSPLGGGAVGLVPFAFYPTDCTPPHGEIGIDDGPTYTEFVSDTSYPVILRWYGPIGLPRQSVDNIAIECNNPSSGCEWFDLTVVFDPIVHPFDQLRAMGLRGGSGVPKDGVYRIRYLEVVEGESLVEDRFYCDDVLDIVRVGAFPENECDVETPDLPAYLFRIQRDCNGNGHPDAEDIAGNPSLDPNENGYIDSCEPVICECDWDGDGTVAVIDIFAFLTDWFANDTAAQNFGGTPGVAAIFAFLNCWFAADPNEPC